MGTEGVGVCEAGTSTCNADGAWAACVDEVHPVKEICNNSDDDNCDGTVDENPDEDGDGYGICDGDCCDKAGECGEDPELINPGAYDVDGTEVDEDCDGGVDNAVEECDGAVDEGQGPAASDFARGIDLCRFTDEDAQGEDRTWGVLGAKFTGASGSGTPDSKGRTVRDGFGKQISNRRGERLVVLSSGHASDNHNDSNPEFHAYQDASQAQGGSGADLDGDGNTLPADYPAMPATPGCTGVSTIHDSVSFELDIRVPTNAQSFSVRMFYFSSEYPEWVCTNYNDFFVTLVDSASPDNPADKNIAIYIDDADVVWPVGVNVLKAADELFRVCTNETISCGNGTGGTETYEGCAGDGELEGTGYDAASKTCAEDAATKGNAGGGTGWLRLSGNVEPGEDMTLRFIVWDTGDAQWDSSVLLDRFEWSADGTVPGVGPQ